MNTLNILRIATAGSVDNGKSTLIGRLLYDTKSIFEDQLTTIERSSLNRGMGTMDLSLFTDGLREEVELGITIDVAYRYFSTPKRKFIIADAPGHAEFTRNMITGASTADAIIILIDANQGITEQTKRHAFIASMLKISNVIVCINKMDAINWNQLEFNKIVQDFFNFSGILTLKNIQFIPISALFGDNVVVNSLRMNWYQEKTLLKTLEQLPMKESAEFTRAVIQCRLGESNDKTNYGIKLLAGKISRNDYFSINALNTKLSLETIYHDCERVNDLYLGMSATVSIANKHNIKRGDIISGNSDLPMVLNEFDAIICWLNISAYDTNRDLLIQHVSMDCAVKIESIDYRVDIHDFHKIHKISHLEMNDIAKVRLKSAKPLVFDSYTKNKAMGSFICIDSKTGATVLAGTIL